MQIIGRGKKRAQLVDGRFDFGGKSILEKNSRKGALHQSAHTICLLQSHCQIISNIEFSSCFYEGTHTLTRTYTHARTKHPTQQGAQARRPESGGDDAADAPVEEGQRRRRHTRGHRSEPEIRPEVSRSVIIAAKTTTTITMTKVAQQFQSGGAT